jgi:CRISPR-associated protein Csy2
MPDEATLHAALLVLPRLRVQNANAISSPLTWGFPSITAFSGLMTALARRLEPDAGVGFHSVGVVCHDFEAQVTQGGYTRSFCLTRNPVLQDGSTAAIVEEGRVHLDITLVFEVKLSSALLNDAVRAKCAAQIGEWVAGMRIAGGSVMPPLSSFAGVARRQPRAQLVLLAEEQDLRAKQFKRLCRQWLPGFALVSRDDVLQSRLQALRASTTETLSQPSLLDAWLDLSRINHRATTKTVWNEAGDASTEVVEWATDSRPGWLVPIPVGYAGLSELHPAGAVAGARDASVPFRFVESVYSIGQWISPHRLRDVAQLTWRTDYTPTTGLYRCTNAYQAPATDTYTPIPFID